MWWTYNNNNTIEFYVDSHFTLSLILHILTSTKFLSLATQIFHCVQILKTGHTRKCVCSYITLQHNRVLCYFMTLWVVSSIWFLITLTKRRILHGGVHASIQKHHYPFELCKAVWTQRAVQTASTCCFQSLLHLFKLLTRNNSCSPQRAGGTKKLQNYLFK